LADELTTEKIDLRQWLGRLPYPFPQRDRASGYRYQLSILQTEWRFWLRELPASRNSIAYHRTVPPQQTCRHRFRRRLLWLAVAKG
jgi:hypothetical protein